MEVYLSLSDGKVFTGERLTTRPEACGLLSFNTTAFAFEECITNPASTGKIILFTFPLVGVAGINKIDNQSNIVTIEGVICKENSSIYSNFRAKTSIKDYLEENKKLYADKFDTRAIMVYLRENGEMPAILSDKPYSAEDVKARFNDKKLNYIQINYPLNTNKTYKAKIVDLGGSKTFYNFLDQIGIYNSDEDFDLVVISNSNYEDYNKEEYIKIIQENKEKKFIAFGDSNILLAKAFGLKTSSLVAGHHGTNIPVKNIETGKDHITGQNHLYYIPEQENINILYKNIHDNSTEAYISCDQKFAGFNFRPGKDTFINILKNMGVK